MKNLIVRREGKICHLMIKKGKEKYEELLLSCILQSKDEDFVNISSNTQEDMFREKLIISISYRVIV